MRFSSTLALLLASPLLALAQYSCDPNVCKLPDCACATTTPPGGLDPAQVPQFVVFTADDAIQSYTIDAVNQFLAQRKNPNGCKPKMTYFASLTYTNYSLITDWYVAGNEIADHTITHMGSPTKEEVNGNLIALNALAGIPLSALKGFRAPLLDFKAETLQILHKSQFLYDSSASASVPVTDPNTNAYWPYTLDNGIANNCDTPGLCNGEPKLPGLWEIPMYAFFDNRGVVGPHLMDPWLDSANGNNAPSDAATLAFMQKTFTDHYNGKRQPIGLYTHPIHVSLSYPGTTAKKSTIDMINSFLDWAQNHDNVWIVSNEQLLDWVRNPVPASQMSSLASFSCPAPAYDASAKICNGVPTSEDGTLARCGFSDFPFFTCYGCPTAVPTVDDPNPAQSAQARFRVPANCSTTYWDPVEGKCLCNSPSCAFTDVARPIGPNDASYQGGGVGGDFKLLSDGSSTGGGSGSGYAPFNGAQRGAPEAVVLWPILLVFLAAAVFGAVAV
ncbi:hypothetical protein DFP72DRAFT_916579 [Ephemerocybe angulata]|uniref:Chitin deacetylase n=1 Tax=Ephemerocybe angulata TaxID=980116 RepID=A0A8H6HKG9_9AGAR|nr:hypothetical protein DFP72DRAFT_916579 [Tulosesus angulatus]